MMKRLLKPQPSGALVMKWPPRANLELQASSSLIPQDTLNRDVTMRNCSIKAALESMLQGG